MNGSQTPKRIEIKYSLKSLIIYVFGNLIFVALGIFLLTTINLKELGRLDIFTLVIAIIFIVHYGIKFIREILKINRKIVIYDNGIEINKTFYARNSISNLKIISEKEYGTGKYKVEYEKFYLTFKNGNEIIKFNIDDFDTTKEKLDNILNSFKSKENIVNKKNIFDETLNFDTFLDLSIKESDQAISETLHLAKENKEELARFCADEIYNETDKIEYIYYALSEDYLEWESFLTSEFQRVFELAAKDNSFDKLTPLLENIIPDISTSKSIENVVQYLYTQLNSKNLEIKLYALEFINLWIDEDSIKLHPKIIHKLNSLAKDENWKIRWNSNRVLKDYKLEYKSNWLDNIRAKFQIPYKILTGNY